MNRAFIFDMDGVIIDTEAGWKKFDGPYLSNILSKEIVEKIGDITGFSIKAICEKAASLGGYLDEDRYIEDSNNAAAAIYGTSSISAGVPELVDFLVANDFKLGLVSASQRQSIDIVLSRLTCRNKFESVVSVNDHPGMRQKPHPDGYIEALRQLDADPRESFILEDSNPGIEAARAAGCFVIGYREHLMPLYQQNEADAHVNTMDDARKIVERFIQR